MSMAPPGRQTDIFYIILGNNLELIYARLKIPKKKRSNELKNFVQQSGHSVRDAHIHQNLGCGYVSVRGREAFFQLGQWLEKVVWEGKTLQVDMRNYDHETALGPGTHPSLESATNDFRPSSPSSTSPSNGLDPGALQVQYAQYQPQAQVSVSPAYVTLQGGYAQQYTYANTAYSVAATMRAPYATNHMSPTITSPYQYADPAQFHPGPPPSQHHAPMSYLQSSYPTVSPTATMQQPAPQARPAGRAMVSTSNRLVHCTRLQGCESKGEIRRKILSVLSAKDDKSIEHLWIPTRPHDGSERGHALILMSSEKLAHTVVRNLKDVKVKGKDGTKRLMKVKIAKEGISDEELAQLNGGSSLASQMSGMSLKTQVTDPTSGEATEQSVQSSYDSCAMSESTGNESAPNIAAEDEEIPGTGRRKSSLPIVDGSYLQSKGASEKGEKESKSTKDREKPSRHGHHSSSKTSASLGSKKSRK